MAERTRRRHDLVRVEPAAWAAMLATRPDLAALPWVGDWALRGWPVMTRRTIEGDRFDHIALGLPLPPSAGKLRLALTLPPQALQPTMPPPTLDAARAHAPAAWQDTINRLIAVDPDVRVFGALAWQTLTGLIYLSDTSDLDLLWPMPRAADVEALLAAIQGVEAQAPMRLDGEVVGAGGDAVNWRELLLGEDQVLVKRLGGVAFEARAVFLEAAR